MDRNEPILQILADDRGVYEVAIRACAECLHTADFANAIQPAVEIIDAAIQRLAPLHVSMDPSAKTTKH